MWSFASRTSARISKKPLALSFASSGALLDAAMTVVAPATSGVVRYDWGLTDTDTAGTYRLEFEVTWNTGKKQTIPNYGYDELVIAEDLG
jgi:uncharacterized protein YfaS (alpha-2-macroglobulin family)